MINTYYLKAFKGSKPGGQHGHGQGACVECLWTLWNWTQAFLLHTFFQKDIPFIWSSKGSWGRKGACSYRAVLPLPQKLPSATGEQLSLCVHTDRPIRTRVDLLSAVEMALSQLWRPERSRAGQCGLCPLTCFMCIHRTSGNPSTRHILSAPD